MFLMARVCVCVNVSAGGWNGTARRWCVVERKSQNNCTRLCTTLIKPLTENSHSHTLTPIPHVLYIYELCVKMFCNEQLTDGNSLTWCKCKNETEQFKDIGGIKRPTTIPGKCINVNDSNVNGSGPNRCYEEWEKKTPGRRMENEFKRW